MRKHRLEFGKDLIYGFSRIAQATNTFVQFAYAIDNNEQAFKRSNLATNDDYVPVEISLLLHQLQTCLECCESNQQLDADFSVFNSVFIALNSITDILRQLQKANLLIDDEQKTAPPLQRHQHGLFNQDVDATNLTDSHLIPKNVTFTKTTSRVSTEKQTFLDSDSLSREVNACESIASTAEDNCDTLPYPTLPQLPANLQQGEQFFSCQQCGRRFTSRCDLISHELSHRNDPIKCDICGKILKNKGNLAVHKTIHAGERQYKCEICEHSFRRRGDMIRHLQTHSDQRRFQCDLCQQYFKSKDTLSGHKRSVHQNGRPFQCGTCEEWFSRRADLERHKLRHKVMDAEKDMDDPANIAPAENEILIDTPDLFVDSNKFEHESSTTNSYLMSSNQILVNALNMLDEKDSLPIIQ